MNDICHKKRDLVEKLGVFIEQKDSLAPVAARILSYIILTGKVGTTFEDLVTQLCASKSTISTEFLGLEMASPIILLSGCVGFGDEYSRLEGFSNSHVGGVVLKGTTLEPRLGNEPHRVIETPSGMLNSIGSLMIFDSGLKVTA